jgi:hypothetical protein
VKTLARLLLIFALICGALRADGTLAAARHAQALLGPDTWSRVIAVENTAPESRYPRALHALVFELAGILWVYTAIDGTQSFSLHVGRLEEEKADFGPLLREIDPGFRRWHAVSVKPWRPKRGAALPNGCFIESIVALRERLASGEPVRNPRLLSYFIGTPNGAVGHTVLVYEGPERIAVLDSAQPERRIRLPFTAGASPLVLARAIEGPGVLRARELKLDAVVEAS